VLAAPKDPIDADRVEAGHVVRILAALRRRFDYVVVDTSPALTEIVMSALEVSDEVHVLATLDVPSLRNLNVFLKTLEQLGVTAERLRLVLNKAERELGVDIDQVAKLLPTGLAMELPYAREVTKSLNLGTPVMALLPAAGISRILEARWSALFPEIARANARGSPVRDGGLFSRVLRRSAPVASAS
jgi:pilus assembly protein CpaE